MTSISKGQPKRSGGGWEKAERPAHHTAAGLAHSRPQTMMLAQRAFWISAPLGAPARWAG